VPGAGTPSLARHRIDPGGTIFRRLDRAGKGKRLSGHAVAKIVKERATAVGLSPKDLSGHYLRSGVATSAARAGKDVFEIVATTGHKRLIRSPRTCARRRPSSATP
jgi:hypothetical protein